MIYFSSHQDSFNENTLGLIRFESLQTLFSQFSFLFLLALKICSFEYIYIYNKGRYVGKRGLTVHEPCKFNVQQKRCIQSKSQDGISRRWSEMMCWMLIWLASSNIEEAIETKKCCGVSWYSIIPLYAYRKKILGLNSFF